MVSLLLMRQGRHKISLRERARLNQNLSEPKVLPALACLCLDEQGGFQLVGANQARLDEQFAQAQCRVSDRSCLEIELLEHEYGEQRLGGQQPLLDEEIAQSNRLLLRDAVVLLSQCGGERHLSDQPVSTEVIAKLA